MKTTRFDNVDVGEMFKNYGYTYIRIEPMTDEDGDVWNAINLDLECEAFFYNEQFIDKWD